MEIAEDGEKILWTDGALRILGADRNTFEGTTRPSIPRLPPGDEL
jgi:hypothetical protein